MNELRRAALSYAARGWFVFPVHSIRPGGACSCGNHCKSPGKHPHVKWREVATTDAEQIKAWWRKWPDANIAITTGSDSGIWAIDVDNDLTIDMPDGSAIGQGDHSLKILESDYGDLPETLSQITGGGGVHYFFAYSEDQYVGNTRDLVSSIDIRAEGGYVLAPGSNHTSGVNYRWLNPDAPVADAPDWVYALIDQPRDVGSAHHLDENGAITRGQRNQYLYRYGASLRGVQGYGFTDLFREIWKENIRLCQPPLDEEEVSDLAKKVSKLSVNELEPTIVLTTEAIGDEPPVRIKAGDDIAISIGELLAKKLDPPAPLIHGLIDAGTGIFLAGEPNVGKSWLVMDMAIAISTGTKFCGFPAEKHPVLIIDQEGSEWGDQQRMQLLMEGRKRTGGREIPLYFSINRGLKLDTTAGVMAVRRLITRYKPKLVIFDSLTRMHSKEENDAGEMAEFFAISKRIMEAHGVAMLFVHHVRKPSGDNNKGISLSDLMRGSSEIRAWPDTILIAQQGDDEEISNSIDITVDKQRWRSKIPPFRLVIDVEEDQQATIKFIREIEPRTKTKTDQLESFIMRRLTEAHQVGDPTDIKSIAAMTRRNESVVRVHINRLYDKNKVMERSVGGKRMWLPKTAGEDA